WPAPKHLWLRNNLSTMVSQLIDSLCFTLVAFYGVFQTSVLLEIVLSTYILKWLVAALDTPFVYLARMLHRSMEEKPGLDGFGPSRADGGGT
ncbi:MAG TPA: VUT family protein, partial [Sediminispirochaeta sp.]|nr:VUT family protein [Sediminispirochaeta sp.]